MPAFHTPRVAVLVVIWFVGQVTAADPAPASVGKALVALGYTEVPLTGKPGGHLYLTMTVAGEKVTALLDTGATGTMLHPTLAKKAKVSLSKEYTEVTGIGGKSKARTGLLDNYTVGGFKGIAVVTHVEDEPAIFDEDRDGVAYQVLLGSNLLDAFSAVIDYDKPAVYLIEPWRKEMRLQGKWQAQTAVTSGEERPGAATNTSVEIVGNTFTLRTGSDEQKATLSVGPLKRKPVHMSLDAGGPEQTACGIFEFDGDDTLRVCLRQTKAEGDADKFPAKFESTKENGHMLLTFTRVKADPPKK